MSRSAAICHPAKPNASRGLCNACWMANKRSEDPEFAERQRAAVRDWNKRNKDYKRRRLLEQYGLTEWIDSCAICGTEETVLDHDHETGLFRGFLCSNCNVAIGMLADDPRRLESAIEYLNAAKWNHGGK